MQKNFARRYSEMSDKLLRALAFDGQVKVYVIDAKETVEEARRRHDTWRTATAALGRTLIGTALLAGNLKGNDQLTTEITGEGPLEKILVTCDAKMNLRGFVNNPQVALDANEEGKIDVSGAVGLPGTLKISKQIEQYEPYVGQVPLVSGEIAEDFTYYMAVSEQTPSSIGLSVLVDKGDVVSQAGGFMIQLMPDATEETITALEETIQNLGRISDLLSEGLSIEQLLDRLVGPGNSKILDYLDVQFNCHCSKDRFESGLKLIKEADLQEMIDEDHEAEIVCHYCNEHYHFTEDELINILNSAKKERESL